MGDGEQDISTGTYVNWAASWEIRELRKSRRQLQTKGLINRTIALHVRYKSLYISLLSSGKQQREITVLRILENANEGG